MTNYAVLIPGARFFRYVNISNSLMTRTAIAGDSKPRLVTKKSDSARSQEGLRRDIETSCVTNIFAEHAECHLSSTHLLFFGYIRERRLSLSMTSTIGKLEKFQIRLSGILLRIATYNKKTFDLRHWSVFPITDFL